MKELRWLLIAYGIKYERSHSVIYYQYTRSDAVAELEIPRPLETIDCGAPVVGHSTKWRSGCVTPEKK